MNAGIETMVEVATKTKQLDENVIVIEAPLFVLFAEYLGYVSIFNKMSEDWCDGKVPDLYLQKVIIVEAKCIYRQMKKDYSIDEIREYYNMYYPLILQEYEDKLSKLIKD